MIARLNPWVRNGLVLVLLLLGGWLVVDKLADTTQTRPDAVPKGSRTEIVFRVETNRYRQGAAVAAETLWGTCAATVSNDVVGGIEPRGDGLYALVVEPQLGEHGRERVIGCLNDLTLDRVRSSVVSVTDGAGG